MSFQQGLSGLNASSKNLEIIGNNVANASTYGAKSSRADFADLYAGAMNGTGMSNIGIGVTVAAVEQKFTQGNITTTDNPLDLAISGSGFFEVQDPTGQVVYTRNGQFHQDPSGNIVNAQGQKLLGYPADSLGNIQAGMAAPLKLPTAGIDPKETSAITLDVGLDPSMPVTTGAIDLTQRKSDTDYSFTSQQVYDKQGQPVAMTYYFKKTAADTWDVYATANGTSVAVDSSNNPAPITTVTFDASGTVPTFNPTNPVTLGLSAMPSLNMDDVTIDLGGMKQNGTDFNVTKAQQNGYAAGTLASVSIDSSGVLVANYSNGQTNPAGQVELANFRNPNGLQPMGGNSWARTYASGDPIVGTPGTGNLGQMKSSALEESNVDLTQELVDMMTAQRVYQANSQTIKTQDSLLQTLISMR